jgi:hypothetical protein
VAPGAEIPYVAWPDRVRRPVPSCLFYGSASLPDAIAARLIATIAARLPDVLFDLAGPVCAGVGPVPGNVHLHERPTLELFGQARIGLSPMTEVVGENDRVVSFARAGLPVIASPAAASGFDPALTACWLVAVPEARSLRDAIVESLDWDWTRPVAEARRIACVMHHALSSAA